MDIIIQPDAIMASAMAAQVMAALIKRKPDAVLGLATGSTPLELYRQLIRLHQEEGLDFRRVTTFNLDEYVGLEPGHPASYHTFMHKHLFKHLNIPREHIHVPDGLASNNRITSFMFTAKSRAIVCTVSPCLTAYGNGSFASA